MMTFREEDIPISLYQPTAQYILSSLLPPRYILVNHGFGLVVKGSSHLSKQPYDLTIFNILYWLLNTICILIGFLQMPVAKV